MITLLVTYIYSRLVRDSFDVIVPLIMVIELYLELFVAARFLVIHLGV